jgi:hypothetical protein
MEEINRNIRILQDLTQIGEYKLLSQKKNIRKIIYKTKNLIKQLKGQEKPELDRKLTKLKDELVLIDDYIEKVLSLQGDQTVFLKMLIDISIDEHTAFKGGDSEDCYYDNVMRKAREFNTLFGKSRDLPGCYDCGTIGRAVFMTYVEVNSKCYHIPQDVQKSKTVKQCGVEKNILPPDVIKRISSEYSFDYDSLDVLNKFKTRLLKSGYNIFICSVSLPTGVGHIFTIESFPNRKYRIYQSSLNEYLLIDHMKYIGYDDSKFLGESDILKLCDVLEYLIRSKEWAEQQKDAYYSQFFHYPLIQDAKTEPFKFEFMFSSLRV